jgi:heptosyltransferase I
MLPGMPMTEAPPTNERPARLPGEDRLPRGGRVLVIRLSALGDVLFALETVAALRRERPDVRIDFLVEDRFESLLVGHPQLDDVLVYPRRRRWRIPASLWALRRRGYDVVFDLHGIQKSAMHVFCARARSKVGAQAPASREGAAWVCNLRVPMPTPLPHRADIGHHLLRAIGLSGEPAPPVLPDAAVPDDLFAGLPRPLVFLHPGTSAFAAFKRWPAERFAALAEQLVERGLGVAVGYGPGEEALARPALEAAPGARGVDGARLGLLGLAAAMRRADVVVAADTGPLHLAAAVGKPCVALFGPKDAARYGPRAHARTHEVLFADVPCRPCRRRTCVTPQCVLGLGVDEVFTAVMAQVASAATGEP